MTPDWVRVYGPDGTLVYNGMSEQDAKAAILLAGAGTYDLRIDRGVNQAGLTAQRIRTKVRV